MICFKRLLLLLLVSCQLVVVNSQTWPTPRPEAKAGTRWWWLGSAVDRKGLEWNLTEYAKAGIGAVEITPLYGVKGNEKNELSFLTSPWMKALKDVEEIARPLGIEVDMNCGTGWPFGGPAVPLEEAACKAVFKDTVINGSRDYTVDIDRTRQKVKRAAPGGEGWVIDHFDSTAVRHYLERFDSAFSTSGVAWPHTFFNDSYEVYGANWTPTLFDEFKKRRGYDLRDHLPELLGVVDDGNKVLADYRETLSDLLYENFTLQWTAWAHSHGVQVRSQAHGSPANLLDLYGAVDIPETEGFGLSDFGIKGLRTDPGMTKKNYSDVSMLKYASSAAHVMGKPFTSSETFTWLTEHFRTSLSQMKPDLDLMFTCGVNHVFFHGSCYSPKDDPWPGWKFYASVDMSPTNSIWRDAPFLMQYIERCQSFLQLGQPDNDFLVYLPVRDMWRKRIPGKGKKHVLGDDLLMMFDIHSMNEKAPEFIRTILAIDSLGYDCDYISDRQLAKVRVEDGMLVTEGGTRYKALIIPDGTTIDSNLSPLLSYLSPHSSLLSPLIIHGIDEHLMARYAKSEAMRTELRLRAIRRKNNDGYHYFIANLTPNDVCKEIPLAVSFGQATWYDPMSGDITPAEVHNGKVLFSFRSGESRVLALERREKCILPPSTLNPQPSTIHHQPSTLNLPPSPITLHFIDEMPKVDKTFRLDSFQTWETLSPEAAVTMGTGVYTTTFTLTAEQAAKHWSIDLGDVRESARVYINGDFIGCAWAVPYVLDCRNTLKRGENTLRIEVTNLPANRIADLDRRGVEWRKMKEINVVDINYKKTNYSHWTPVPSGLASQVRLIEEREERREEREMRGKRCEMREMRYYPEGKDIVCQDGDHRYNRALYGGYTEFRLETSDRPIFAVYRKNGHRNIRFILTANGKSIPLELTTHAEARYNAGKRVYKLTDDSWGKGVLTITTLAQHDRESAVWCFEPKDMPQDAKVEMVVCDIKNPKFKRSGDMNADETDNFEPAPDKAPLADFEWRLGEVPTYVTLEGVADKVTFDNALKHHEWLANNIVFKTPDPYINAMDGALMAAADGAWDGKVWLHGAVAWRMQLNGWRAGYLGDVLGMPERALSHFSAYAGSQVTDVPPTIPNPTSDPEKLYSREQKKWGTQMYSNGYICRYPDRKDVMHHYDMNLNYIDELLMHFQYDADKEFLRKMFPVIKAHLQWEKRNFDPDDDGLYDAYCCIWASDALYYNGGAVSYSTAYNYRALRMAARIAEILGEDPTYYRAEAEKTLKAMNERLWIGDRGHWAEYEDLMGLKRKHEHAALWSIYTPIDCGVGTEEQAIRATQYVDSCMPRIPMEMSHHLISTSDWQPYEWSINNVAGAEMMHMALAYFQAGRADEGFQLLKANILDNAYFGGSPGNIGQISHYDKARGELYRDFSDNVGITSRAFIQGLYGIVPDALNGRCVIRPGFPTAWDSASIETPYMKYSFRREGNKEIYEIEQNFAQPLQIVLRQNTGNGYVETVGSAEKKQTIVVDCVERQETPKPLLNAEYIDGSAWGNNFDEVRTERLDPVALDAIYNSNVTDIFKNDYLSPRPKRTTLMIPLHGIGDWCHPQQMADIDDTVLRSKVTDGVLRTSLGIPFRTPAEGCNIAYTSLWDNYPDSVTIPLKGKATHAYLLMAGSTNHMQSRIDNGQVVVEYTDGTTTVLPLQNPHNWCPIEQDYYEDGMQFHAAQPRPYRIDFTTTEVSRNLIAMGKRYGYQQRFFKGGAGVILDMPLDGKKRLKSLCLRTLSNDVVMGIMAVTLQRP